MGQGGAPNASTASRSQGGRRSTLGASPSDGCFLAVRCTRRPSRSSYVCLYKNSAFLPVSRRTRCPVAALASLRLPRAWSPRSGRAGDRPCTQAATCTHVEVVRSYLVCLVPCRQRFQEQLGGKDYVGIALDAPHRREERPLRLLERRHLWERRHIGGPGTDKARLRPTVHAPKRSAERRLRLLSCRQACPPGTERHVPPDSSIALRATSLFGFRGRCRCHRLLRCSTARSQPDDHDRGCEHVRLDLPVFQEVPPERVTRAATRSRR